jgi:hypothetical protein
MVTHVSCVNRKCPAYDKKLTVASAEILRMNAKICPTCDGPMKIAKQVNTSHKSGGTKRPSGYRKGPGRKRGTKR